MQQYTVSFVGAGRVAGALCRRFHNSGIKIRSIVSRAEVNGKELAAECGAEWNNVPEFSEGNDIIIVAVPDDSLRQLLSGIRVHGDTMIAHTAGSLGMEVFPGNLKHKGVFYPLQTFSNGRKVNFEGVPFILEASDSSTLTTLTELAKSTGGNAFYLDESQRELLHIAAVFVNNFTNHMLACGNQITDRSSLPFSLLGPLIRETVDKALEIGPGNSQTGPASRADEGTIEKHIKLLSFSPELQRVYMEQTRAIIGHYKKSTDDQL